MIHKLCVDHPVYVFLQMQLLTRLRLARNFPKYTQRLKCVMARLQAISILGKCMGRGGGGTETAAGHLYPG